MHPVPEALFQGTGEVQGEVLGAVWMRVMGNHQQLAYSLHARRLERIARRLQVGVSVALVGLKVRAFGPLVPRVHEHQPLAGFSEAGDRVPRGVLEPISVAPGGGAQEHGTASGASGFVVPGGVYTSIQGVLGVGIAVAARWKNGPIEDDATEFGIQGVDPVGDDRRVGPVGRKLNRHIHAIHPRVFRLKRLRAGQLNLAKSFASAPLPPALGRFGRFWQQVWPVYDQQRPAVDADVARVPQVTGDVCDKRDIVIRRVLLLDQKVVIAPVPTPAPVLVRPAEAEGEIEAIVVEKSANGRFQQRFAREPVEIEGKSPDTIQSRQLHLPMLDGRHP